MFNDDGLANAFKSAGDSVFATTCSRWSSRRRIMGPPYAGNYGWKYHPWVKGILDSKATFNVTLKSAQGGFTEIAINRALWHIDINKRDVLYVLPTATNAGDFSKARFGGALHNSPYLKSLFTSTNSIGLKQAGATNLYIRGSRGDSNLKSVPASVLMLDEFDEFDQRAVYLALERLSGQPDKEIWFISTPTIPNYGVSKEYLMTTQEHYTFKCPLCSRHTELMFPECLEMFGETINDRDVHKSYLKCKECQGKLPHETKFEWLANGTWKSTYENGDPDRRGYYMNQLYSSTVSPAELTVAYLRGLGDEFAAQEWNNSKLGLPFVGESSQLNDTQIDAAVRDYSTNDARPIVGGSRKIRTLGYDQGKTGYYVVIEWTFERVSKDINMVAHAKVVDFGKILQQSEGWGRLHELMREWQINFCIIDADPEISDARRFARTFPGYVHLSRYRRGQTGKELAISEEDTDAGMVVSDRTHWVGITLGRFRVGTIEIPRDISAEFREHMKALVKRYEKDNDGNLIAKYLNIAPDHFAHALVYAEQALPFAASISAGVDINSVL